LTLLFQWGKFDASDVQATRFPLVLFAAAVPFYAWATLLTRCYHARKDMKTPLKLAAVNFLLNLLLSLVLMRLYGTTGLASANLLVAVAHCLMLNQWKPVESAHSDAPIHKRWIRIHAAILASAIVMGLTL
ncbi:lipid II flippase MurJ, partial [Arthrospira platensis SPKY1]|nr:lipid II flippase MurJ [Arthrospira platensis SPKY1]